MRWGAAITVLAVMTFGCGDAAGQRRKTMPPEAVRIFPPKWNPGDQWSAVIQTEVPAPADFQPRFGERTLNFRVTADARAGSDYRLEVHGGDGPVYALYFRKSDFTLARVARVESATAEETLLTSGDQPFVYYERRLPIIPDFPMASLPGRREFTVGRSRIVQDIQITGDQARIVLEQREAMSSLKVTMDWSAGDPWWSRIQCTENPPPGAPVPAQVVASGYLLKDSIIRR